ncbi:transporter substrate-binding domain-containing protein [Bradyrhizobium sp. IC3069]|uniref:ABC-type amino acid transport substrate-binding protein n=1 Tax=Bradyrhizobium yuanmingense TaxID=108015 RepID=A0A1C3X9M7_9BRAD|nr:MULTISPECIES: transporter substrate-binding domain-containing protein [Bradyrhizobium]MCA1382630.1 transporter substrate-binding domain-containing protein [Bradyrhizobium sp. BRP05]MCA1361143.1 transporter substrate-binding domain-containing protein [Bradyrhizobium sp. IC4059]MCA1391542.1 transporter substrate-binding domain-containing protein [Bradyrhizobium sp. IC3123]MCA1421737.1 transporter substrate-binding domain-containing protein [Bradyrhizobium sp. BRP23]MCA1429410.1 transporter su
MRGRRVAWSVAAVLSAMASVALAADDPLKVCLDEDRPPLSVHRRDKPDAGFDVLLAQAIAERMGRPLKIQWFESRLDEDSSPQLEANALLSDGRCSLVGGYALTQDSLVAPGMKTARLPGFAGATRDDRRRRVPLGVLAPSQPYIYSPMTVVLGPKARGRKVGDIGDLAGLRLAIESGSLGDAILMTFDKGRLIDNITHLVPGRDDLLGGLERGDHDATLIDLARFDAHRAAHPDTAITASGYYYPIGANRGYVGLASDGALIAAVNKALTELTASGKIAEFGKQAGLTYLPPREPAILGDVWTKIIQR